MGQSLRLFVYSWHDFDARQTFAPLSNLPYSIFLDSARNTHPLSRYSYICFDPFETICAKNGIVKVSNKDNEFEFLSDPFRVVRERLNLWADYFSTKSGLSPFQGGACGFFGYDLARTLERLPVHATPHNQPDMMIGIYNKVVVFDHQKNKSHLFIHAKDEKTALKEKAGLENIILSHRPKTYEPQALAWETKRNDKDFTADIQAVIDYVHAGDIFQANLSRRFTARPPEGFDAFSHYSHLRSINAAPYGAFMHFDDITLASCSPERFLSVTGKTIETRPIKGTVPSHLPVQILEDSEKDRAENIMIVDLLRNDLSKVCEDHSVTVDNLCAIETFEGLHHMVSTIRGSLRADQSPLDALRACFPGGSITGAPKIRAMEIIDELEPDRRGAYCGCMAYIGFDGAMDSAITIRTLVYAGGEVSLQTGGGITALSDAQKEFEETLTKAQKIFESFAPPEQERKTA